MRLIVERRSVRKALGDPGNRSTWIPSPGKRKRKRRNRGLDIGRDHPGKKQSSLSIADEAAFSRG